jgi:type II secretory pathway pseudopilin PulG
MMKHLRSKGPAQDAGDTLIEVLVAAILMAVAAGAIGTILVSAIKASTNDRQRVAASNLAQREIENSRNIFGTSDTAALALGNSDKVVNPTPYPSGAVGTPSVVDGSTYTVTRQAQWLPTGNGASACDGSSLVTYPSLRITVSVTWANNTGQPVTDATLLTPQKSLLGNTTESYVAVKVINSSGALESGVNVNLSGPASGSALTDSSGCAVFMVTNAGTYSVALNNPGFVDNTGTASPTKSQAVAAGQLYVLPFSYDKAATIRVVQSVLGGYPQAVLPGTVNYGNSALPGVNHSVAVASGGVYTTVTNLWPSTDGYTAWSGGCADSDPGSTGAGRGTPTVVAPGATSDVQSLLAPIDVTVSSKATNIVTPGVTVTATSTSTCPSGQQTITLGVTDSTGHIKT